jgi:hypothetical protein
MVLRSEPLGLQQLARSMANIWEEQLSGETGTGEALACEDVEEEDGKEVKISIDPLFPN